MTAFAHSKKRANAARRAYATLWVWGFGVWAEGMARVSGVKAMINFKEVGIPLYFFVRGGPDLGLSLWGVTRS